MRLDHHPPPSYQALFFEEQDVPLPLLLLLPYRRQWWFPSNAVTGVNHSGLSRAVGYSPLPAKPPGRPLPLRRRSLLRLRRPDASPEPLLPAAGGVALLRLLAGGAAAGPRAGVRRHAPAAG